MATSPPAKKANIDDEKVSALTFEQTMGPEIVELIVSPEGKKFFVHKELLCNKIPYFEKMFQGGFVEAANKSATFPEDTVECFDLLLGWVYSGKLRALTPERKVPGGPFLHNWEFQSFYTFAHKLCLPDLQDYAMDTYICYAEEQNVLPLTKFMKVMYKEGAPDCGLRRFALASFRQVTTFKDGKSTKIWPIVDLQKLLAEDSGLALDFATSVRNGDEVKDPRKMERCTFHQHGKDKPCYLVAETEKR